MTVTIDDIRAAAATIQGAVMRTPFLPAPKLSALAGAEIIVKYENLHVTNSFKERGALVKLTSLDAEQRRIGVIAISAGNHAQAVAYHASRLGIPATIVMPDTTPFVKIVATRNYGAQVVLGGESLAETQGTAEDIAGREGLAWVHPYDDPAVIAGQGTMALEMLEEVTDLDDLVIPVGGGGLIAGNALAAKAIRPEIRITGVEVDTYPSMAACLDPSIAMRGGPTLAEGIAVKNAGRLTAPIVREHVDKIALVSESEIERAVFAFLTLQKTMAEGAGAAGLAGVLADTERYRGRKIGLVLCGGNIDPRILAAITVRGLEREDRIISFRITIDDRPGVLGRLSSLVGQTGANILEVSHHRLFLDVPAKGAIIHFTVETQDGAHAEEVMAAVSKAGYPCRRLAASETGMDRP